MRMRIRWASLCGQLGQAPTRGRRPEGIGLHGLAPSVFLLVLATWIEVSYSEIILQEVQHTKVSSTGPVRRWHIVYIGT